MGKSTSGEGSGSNVDRDDSPDPKYRSAQCEPAAVRPKIQYPSGFDRGKSEKKRE
jgi:hypothetical protein